MLQLEPRRPASHAELRLAGAFDTGCDRAAQEAWTTLLETRPPAVVIEVSRLTDVGSRGVRFLLWCHMDALVRHCPWAIVTGNDPWLNLALELLCWDLGLPLCRSLDTALRRLLLGRRPELLAGAVVGEEVVSDSVFQMASPLAGERPYDGPQAPDVLDCSVHSRLAEPSFLVSHAHPVERRRVFGVWGRAAEEGRPGSTECRLLGGDWQEAWLPNLLAPFHAPVGEVLQPRGNSARLFSPPPAVEQRRLIEPQHHGNEEQSREAVLEAILQAAPVGLALCDGELRCRQANAAACALFGHPEGSILDWALEELVARCLGQEEAGEWVAGCREVLIRDTPGEIRTTRFPPSNPGEPPRYVTWQARQLARDDARIGILIILSDITDWKVVEEDLRASADNHQRAEDALRFLAHAGAILSGSLDYEATLHNLAQVSVPVLADSCCVDTVERNGDVRRVAVAHADARRETAAKDLFFSSQYRMRTGRIRRVIRTREAELCPHLSTPHPRTIARDDEHCRALSEVRPHSELVVPLIVRDRVLGTLTFALSRPDRRFTREDLFLACELSARGAVALENAQLYTRTREIVTTLQGSLLPVSLPMIPGVEVAAHYRAAEAGMEVGGDFYDLFSLSDHSWFIVIGDVTGKGAPAAALTALIRHTIRAVAPQVRWPHRVLARVNDAVLEHSCGEQYSSALCVDLLSSPGKLLLRAASAGHPPMLILRGCGRLEVLDEPGLLLGVLPDLDLPNRTAELGPGDVAVLYTDGVTEARHRGNLYGEERLAELVRGCRGMNAWAIAARIEGAVVGFQHGEPADDIALLVLRVEESPEADGTCSEAKATDGVAERDRRTACCESWEGTRGAGAQAADDLSSTGTPLSTLAARFCELDHADPERTELLLQMKRETGLLWKQIAHVVGLSHDYVRQLAGLAGLDESVRARARRGEIPIRTAMVLKALPPEVQTGMAERVVNERMTAEQVRAAIAEQACRQRR